MSLFKKILLCFLVLPDLAQANELVGSVKPLNETCGYTLSEELKRSITQRESQDSNGVHSETIALKMSLGSGNALGSLRFSCLISDHHPVDGQDFNRKTAREEIELEDSGGRYARVISWGSEFVGHGWQGTIAYTNSILGDGTLLPIDDLFYVCPRTIELTCFSLEIKSKAKITESDKDEIVSILSTISHSPQ